MYISNAVGAGGVNKKNDTQFIQELLNILATMDTRLDLLDPDGACGTKTKEAIGKYQKYIVKLKNPDKRIDPDGRSEKILIANIISKDKAKVQSLAKKYGLVRSGAKSQSSSQKQIVYRQHARKSLSNYTESVIKLAMKLADVNKCDISSTLRTFDDQTRIMYNNCSSYPGANSVTALRSARGWGYAAAGRAVEEVYYSKKGDGEEKCRQAMKAKIEALYKENKKVSLHCVSEADYKKKNVLDIPYSSVIQSKHKAFETALMGMTKEIKNIRYKKPAQAEIYIDRLIIEDKCWHLEIPQNGNTIVNKEKTPVSATQNTKITHQAAQMQSLDITLRSILKFLDELF